MPRVPIATGAIAGIFSGNLVVVGLALYCILLKSIWRLVVEERSVLGLYQGGNCFELFFILVS